MTLEEKASRVKAVVLDIDGVLSDGRIGYGGGDDEEIKFFDVKDGHAIKMAMRAGLLVGVLTGRSSAANRRRSSELGLSFIHEGAKDKLEGFGKLTQEIGLTAEECMYVGDDLIDIPPMRRAGVAVAVADAAEELKTCCDFQTRNPGGRGAVREAITWLLKTQGKWDGLVRRYLDR